MLLSSARAWWYITVAGVKAGRELASIIIILYTSLILRILFRAEQQKNIFGRSYAYGTASLIFMHFFINIGMSIGLVPTIGIPLPFISYGGSSMYTFTTLVFVYLNIDANRLNETRI